MVCNKAGEFFKSIIIDTSPSISPAFTVWPILFELIIFASSPLQTPIIGLRHAIYS